MGSKGHGIEELSEFAMEFIKKAGKKALPFYGKGQTRFKFDQGMVTEADLRIADYF
jgi:fructose-1,6-bisphosphatase/inositol monophosphatase family enzyme